MVEETPLPSLGYTCAEFVHSDFRLLLIHDIIEMFGESKASRNGLGIGENPLRLTGRYFPSLIPPTMANRCSEVMQHLRKHNRKTSEEE